MSNNEKLQEAISKLGWFVGEIGQHQFMSSLLDVAAASDNTPGDPVSTVAEWDAATDGPTITDPAMSPAGKMISALLGMTDGGTTVENLKQAIKDFLKDAGDSGLAAKLDTGENRILTLTHVGDETEKWLNDVGMEAFQLENVNTEAAAPSKEHPNVSILQIHDVALNFANRDTGVVGTFMNMIPTLEMSKCQPYVDVKVITQFPQLETVGGKTRVGDGISLFRFLRGKAEIGDDDDAGMAMATATPVHQDENGDWVVTNYNTFYDAEGEPLPVTVAGMEIFTSPQTMVDAENDFIDLEPVKSNDDGTNNFQTHLRNAPTIDKFRPFMTFKSINFQVAPARGMMCTETGDIAFTLHDRSRLGDIAQFVRPSSVGKEVELAVEWGWSHPEAGQADGRENYFAELLNAMRVKKKYMVVNSSLTFDNVGQVEIKCKIVTKGARETTNLLITSSEITDQLDAIQEIIQEIRAIKRTIRADLGDNEEMVGKDVLGKANSASSIMGLKKEDMSKLRKLAKDLRTGKSGEYKDLGTELTAALSGADSLETMISSWFTNRKKTGVFDKINPANKIADPFIKQQSSNKIHVQGKHSDSKTGGKNPYRGKNHVSFAKIATFFIANPMAQSGRFDEVQMVFYPFNAQAAFAADLDIGSFPINVTKFKELMLEEFKKRPNMTIAQFVGRMNSNFFGNMACDGYGFSDIYDRDKESGKATLAKKYKEGEKNQAAARSAKIDVLEKAYGPDADPKFKRPQIQMFIECVPGTLDSGGNRTTILRLHFFDKVCSSYTGFSQMWDSMRSSMMSSINKTAIALSNSISAAADGDKEGPAAQLSNHSEQWEKQWAVIDALDLLEVVDEDGGASDFADAMEPFKTPDGKEETADSAQAKIDAMKALAGKQIRIKGGPHGLRYLLSRNMPTIKYGTATSAVISAGLATKSDSKVATIHMTTQKEPGKRTPGAHDDGLPLRTFPAELSLETFGCPLINFGQQFFVDFQTGTSVDDVYVVTGIDHSLAPGEFKTKLKMTPMMKFGQFQSLIGNIGKLHATIAGLDKDSKK